MKLKMTVAALIILTFTVVGAGAMRTALTPYTTFAEAKTSGRTVQVIGNLGPEQEIIFDPATGELKFDLVDREGVVLPVIYRGTKPNDFERATDIVVVGRYADAAFAAQQLLVKCPSKYQGEESGQ